MSRPRSTDHAPVRPRWVWAGAVALLAGMVLVGVGVGFSSWPWAIAGVVVLVLGAGVARHGRILHDVGGSDARTVVREVKEGDVRQGVKPGDMAEDDDVRRNAARATAQTRAVLSRHQPRAGWTAGGGLLIGAAAAGLLGAQLSLYRDTAGDRQHSVTMLAPLILLGLCAVGLLTSAERSHRLLALVGVLAGVLTLLVACLVGTVVTEGRVFECVCGGVAVLGGLAAFVRPVQKP